MLLQAVALSRLIFALCKSGSTERPFIVAVYLTRCLTAEGYIVMKLHWSSMIHRLSNNTILYILPRFLFPTRDLILLKKMVLILSSARVQFASMLKSILDKLDFNKCSELAAVKQDASGMKSFHNGGAWRKTNRTESKGGLVDSIPEEKDAWGSGEGEGVQSLRMRMKATWAFLMAITFVRFSTKRIVKLHMLLIPPSHSLLD